VSAVAIDSPAGQPDRILAHIIDIGDRVDRAERLETLATVDPLTGLPNRTAIETLLGAAMSEDGQLGVLFVDADRFKDINDRHGHRAGDEVLVHISQRLSEAVRPSDVVGRLGGDEFVVICPGAAGGELRQIRDRIDHALAAPMLISAGSLAASVSTGVAEGRLGDSAAVLLERADAAMYEMKRARQAERQPTQHPGSPTPS